MKAVVKVIFHNKYQLFAQNEIFAQFSKTRKLAMFLKIADLVSLLVPSAPKNRKIIVSKIAGVTDKM